MRIAPPVLKVSVTPKGLRGAALLGYFIVVLAFGTDANATSDSVFGTNLCLNDDSTTSDQFTDWSTEKTLVSNGNRVYAVWIDFRDSKGYWETDVYLAMSGDGGTTFGQNVRVNSAPIGAAHRNAAVLAVDQRSGNIYVAWAKGYGRESDIYFARSIDGGNSFEYEFRISEEPSVTYQVAPSVAVDNQGIVYVVWRDHRNGGGRGVPSSSPFSGSDIYIAKSTNAGATFGENIKVTAGYGPRLQDRPVVDVDDANTIYIAWEDGDERFDGDARIRVTSSTDGGVRFGPERVVSTLWGWQWFPSMDATGEGLVYITYTSDGLIYFTKSLDGGVTFVEPIVVATGHRSSVDIDEVTGTVYVSWEAGDSVFAAVSEDQGEEFLYLGKVNDSENAATAPRTSADSGRVHFIWDDGRNGNLDVYYARSIAFTDPTWLFERLLTEVPALGLPEDIEQNLVVKLHAARHAIDRGLYRVAARILRTFATYVEIQRGIHITDVEAVALIRITDAIIALLEQSERPPRRERPSPRERRQ
jgi:hypothetical protein